MFSPAPAAGDYELARTAASSGQEIPVSGILLGVLQKVL